MSIVYQVLGAAGQDNALFVWVTSGHGIHRLLFDCGEGCVAEVPSTDVLAIDHLLFSHLHMDHIGPSMAYLIREKPRFNVDRAKLEDLGLRPGPWLERVEIRRPDEAPLLAIEEATYELAALRNALLIEKPGDSLAYLTDFILDQTAMERLMPEIQGYKTLICESQYRRADAAFAQRNYHMTAVQAAELARQAYVEQLILFLFPIAIVARNGWNCSPRRRRSFLIPRFPAIGSSRPRSKRSYSSRTRDSWFSGSRTVKVLP